MYKQAMIRKGKVNNYQQSVQSESLTTRTKVGNVQPKKLKALVQRDLLQSLVRFLSNATLLLYH